MKSNQLAYVPKMSRLSKQLQSRRRPVIIGILLISFLYYQFYTTSSYTKTTDDLKMLHVSSKSDHNISVFVNESHKEKLKPSPIQLNYVVVHLDFKGMPPKIRYLRSLLVTLKRHGVKGLLIEYEDMFPFERKLTSLSVAYHYEKDELKGFLQFAATLGLEIIPLIQTFGHMEYVLKHKEFNHLSENPLRVDSLCPSQRGSLELIKEMLTQVISFHQSIVPLKHVHIGCDEIYTMNKCTYCTKRNLSNLGVYLDHVGKVDAMVQTLAPNATTLIWWDMLKHMHKSLRDFPNRYDNVELVYWEYTPNIRIKHEILSNLVKKFPNIWIASAFKGADERNSILPNIMNRVLNTLSWMRTIKESFRKQSPVNNVKGIILTGWSKYNHFGPVSDLLVPSIPSLIINLAIINQFKNKIITKDLDNVRTLNDVASYIKIVLPCDQNIDFSNNLTSCYFEGHKLYTVLYNYVENIRNLKHKAIEMLLSPYNEKHLHDYQKWCIEIQKNIIRFKRRMMVSMAPYYEKIHINEYVKKKISETIKKIYTIHPSDW